MKRHRNGGLVVFFCALAVTAAAWLPLAAQAAEALSAKDQKELADVLQWLDRGDHATAHKSLAALVSRLTDGQIETLAKQMADKDQPSLGKLLGVTRLMLVAQGLEKSLPTPSAREAILVLPEFQAEISGIFDKLFDEPLLADPLPVPGTIEDFDTPLWQAHVLENKLANTEKYARHMVELVKRVPRTQVAKLTDEQRQPLEANYDELLQRVKQYARVVEEREIELRLRRLELAHDVLAKPELTRQRWFAAGAWSVDEYLIQEFLKESKGDKPLRAALQASGLAARVQRLAADAGKLAGDLTAKVNLFGAGLHWWMRGRYGQGPEFYGLAKSQYAMRTPSGEFALRMPSETPQPTDPTKLTSLSQVPQYDRRHHFWWAWEYRQVARSGYASNTGPMTTEKIEGSPKLKTVWLKDTSFT